VTTTTDRGKSWRNQLHAAEAAGFELLLTADENLCYQQNLTRRKIAIVVLGNTQWPI
jgi:hypothetical protein